MKLMVLFFVFLFRRARGGPITRDGATMPIRLDEGRQQREQVSLLCK